MKPDLKKPLTFEMLFGILEPTQQNPLSITHTPSIAAILDCFPIKHDEEVLELNWDTEECCKGWFLREGKDETYGRVHGGCDGDCGKELPVSSNKHLLTLRIPDYPRKPTDPLELLLQQDDKKWILKFIPAIKTTHRTIPPILTIACFI